MIPFIVNDIIDAVISQMENADYDENARVFIGDRLVLIDREDFEELKKCAIDEKDADFDEILNRKWDY